MGYEIELVSVVGIGLTIIGLIVEHFYFLGGLRERIATLESNSVSRETMMEMSEDIREVKTKIDLFWGALEAQIPSLLLKGNPISSDSKLFSLLQKFMSKTISKDEIFSLVCELDKEAKVEEHSPGERISIVLISAVVKARMDMMENGNGSPCNS